MRQQHGRRESATHTNLPLALVGGGSGKLKGGRHLRYAEETPINNLLLSMLEGRGAYLETGRHWNTLPISKERNRRCGIKFALTIWLSAATLCPAADPVLMMQLNAGTLRLSRRRWQ